MNTTQPQNDQKNQQKNDHKNDQTTKPIVADDKSEAAKPANANAPVAKPADAAKTGTA